MNIIAIMAVVWYIPGWLRTQTPQEGCLESLTNTYETASVEFKAWNGDIPIWPKAVEHADATAERFAAEVIAMPEEARTNLTIEARAAGVGAIVKAAAAPVDDVPDALKVSGDATIATNSNAKN